MDIQCSYKVRPNYYYLTALVTSQCYINSQTTKLKNVECHEVINNNTTPVKMRYIRTLGLYIYYTILTEANVNNGVFKRNFITACTIVHAVIKTNSQRQISVSPWHQKA